MASPFKDLQCRTDLGEEFKQELLDMFDKVLQLTGEAKGESGNDSICLERNSKPGVRHTQNHVHEVRQRASQRNACR
jgi:hypothetical protein